MSRILFLVSALILATASFAQQNEEALRGTVSYVSSQNVYVRFTQTAGIEVGDTLFLEAEKGRIPALIVLQRSSISCVCQPITERVFREGETLAAFPGKPQSEASIDNETELPSDEEAQEFSENEEIASKEKNPKASSGPSSDSEWYGRIGVSSYSSFTNEEDASHRMRYVASVNGNNIANTRLGFESYLAFTHRDEQWDLIKANVYHGLKIYGLSVNYAFNPDTRIWLGRKINRNLSGMGAVDGVQLEKRFSAFTAGLLLGSRPDPKDYTYNADLFQVGAFVSHQVNKSGKFFQSSVALVDQENKWNTDRRFLYLQHSNSLLKNLYLFASSELDLYEKLEGVEKNSLRLTNAFVSLRYSLRRNLRLAASYSARNNIIYYESNKDFIQRLLEYEALQGYRLSLHYKPLPLISLGVKAGYRFRKEDDKPARNLYAYATFSNIPLLQVSATLSSILLQTSYVDGEIYALQLSRDLYKGKVYGGLNLKITDYSFIGSEQQAKQQSAEVSLQWRAMNKLIFSLQNEFVKEGDRNYGRLYLSLQKRF